MPGLQTATGLSLLLGAFDRDRFFAEHWEQRSIHFAHHEPSRFARIISHESFFEREVARCAHLKASTRGADGWNQEIRIQPDQAEKLFRLGMTICATNLDRTGPCAEVIGAYASEITTATPPHINCYYSPDQCGYGLHFDTHPVWILQVAGTKHWTVSFEPGVRNPRFNVLYPPGRDRIKLPWITIDRPDVDDPEHFMQVTLEPGDVLYMPAGAWHAARAEGSSLALTLAVGRMTTADLFGYFATQIAPQRRPDTATRLSPFPRDAAYDGRGALRDRIAADLAQLKELVTRVDAETLLKIYEHFAEHPEAVEATRQLADATAQRDLMMGR
jgi:bifunctional lysine-specific demethylase and histidyl-hydroxylase NO66